MRWINPSGSSITPFVTDSGVVLIAGSALIGWQDVSSAIIRTPRKICRIIIASDQVQHSGKERLRESISRKRYCVEFEGGDQYATTAIGHDCQQRNRLVYPAHNQTGPTVAALYP